MASNCAARSASCKALEESLHEEPIDGHIGIAHTRWATHGEPNETNSHPHRDATETVFVCHNGIIENYAELRPELEARGRRVSAPKPIPKSLPNLIKRAYDETAASVCRRRCAKRWRRCAAPTRWR